MNTSEERNLKTAADSLQMQTKQQIEAALWVLVGYAVIFVLPHFIPRPWDEMVMAFGSAMVLTVLVSRNPASFRNRNGSLTTAVYLTVALWLGAIAVTVLRLIGRH